MRTLLRSLCAPLTLLAACLSLSASSPESTAGGGVDVDLQQQQAVAREPDNTGLISGGVVDAATGLPVPGAVVFLGSPKGAEASPTRQLADSSGRFAFADLSPTDRVQLTASHSGYFEGGFTDVDRPGTSTALLTLAVGEQLRDVRIELWKPGSMSGVVLDELGEPVAGVYVRAIAMLPIAGHDRLAAGPVTKTDDRGRYRLSPLVPGRYVVSVPSVQGLESEGATAYPTPPPPSSGQRLAYPVTFHPAASAIDQAVPVDLEFGDHRAGVDVRLAPAAARTISGRVERADGGTQPAGTTLRIIPAGIEELGLGSEVAVAAVASDGTFRFETVPEGRYTIDVPFGVSQYVLTATTGSTEVNMTSAVPRSGGTRFGALGAGPPGTRIMSAMSIDAGALWTRTSVAVSGRDVDDVVVTLRSTATLRGRMTFELDASAPPLTRAPGAILFAEAADGNISFGQAEGRNASDDPTGSFVIHGLGPAAYLIRPHFTWLVKSITYNGRDHTHTPFDAAVQREFNDVMVTLTNASASITGAVRDDDGNAIAGAHVVAYPSDRSRWTDFGTSPPDVRHATTSPSGSFRLTALPGGDYLVVAAAPGSGDWRDRGFFNAMAPFAESVSIDWGASVTRDLVVADLRAREARRSR